VAIVASASSIETNHLSIVKSKFYKQFKSSINENYPKLMAADEEVELFGLVNLALSKKHMQLIYKDLRKVHKIAMKSNKIDFKTKVDLLSELSKFVAQVSRRLVKNSQKLKEYGYEGTTAIGNYQKSDDEEEGLEQSLDESSCESYKSSGDERDFTKSDLTEKEKDPKVTLQRKCKRDEEMIDEALRALVFTLVRLIGQLDEDNFAMFKYFLAAVQACTQNLKHQLVYLVKIEALLKFLHRVLDTDFRFDFKGFDDTVLNFSLRILVCEIFFHMKSE
jgi:hypothetical protein